MEAKNCFQKIRCMARSILFYREAVVAVRHNRAVLALAHIELGHRYHSPQAHRMQWLWAQAVVIAATRVLTEQLHRWQAQHKLTADKAVLLEAAVQEVVALAVPEAVPRRELPQATEQEMQAVQAQLRPALVAAAAAAAAVQLVAMLHLTEH